MLNDFATPSGIAIIMNYCKSGPEPSSTVWELQALGGAMRAVPQDAAASSNLRSSNAVLIMQSSSCEPTARMRALLYRHLRSPPGL